MKAALIIGITDYRNPDISTVRYAAADATGLAAALRDSCGFERVELITSESGEDCGLKSITARLDRFKADLKREDQFLFYFAGHGIERNDRCYLLTPDTWWQKPHNGSLALSDLRDYLDEMLPRERIVLMDMCRNSPEVSRGIDPDSANVLSRDIKTLAAPPRRQGQTAVLTACQPGQRAFEDHYKKHGVFTWFLLQGLRDGAWVNGTLQMENLAKFVQQNVGDWVTLNRPQGSVQDPWYETAGAPTPIVLAKSALTDVIVPAVNADDIDSNAYERIRDEADQKNHSDQPTASDPAGDGFASVKYLHAPFSTAEVTRARAFWTTRSGLPCSDDEGFIVNLTAKIPLRFAIIPPGDFLMGSHAGAVQADPDEKPSHLVRLTGVSFLGVFPVTQEQYHAITGTSPSRYKPRLLHDQKRSIRTNLFPVESVNYHEACACCKLLNDRFPLPDDWCFGIPSEALWEYACRAGTTDPFSFGLRLSMYVANFGNNHGFPTPVGQYAANAFGLYDMHGNILEWCSDHYAADYYVESLENDPGGPTNGSPKRITRGGAWNSPAVACRSACRSKNMETCRTDNIGFRIAIVKKTSLSNAACAKDVL